jgi:hypothetical protein
MSIIETDRLVLFGDVIGVYYQKYINTLCQSAEFFLLLRQDGSREIKSRVAMARATFNKKEALFTSRLDLKLRKRLVKCYVWNIAFMMLKIGHFGK